MSQQAVKTTVNFKGFISKLVPQLGVLYTMAGSVVSDYAVDHIATESATSKAAAKEWLRKQQDVLRMVAAILNTELITDSDRLALQKSIPALRVTQNPDDLVALLKAEPVVFVKSLTLATPAAPAAPTEQGTTVIADPPLATGVVAEPVPTFTPAKQEGAPVDHGH